MLLCRDGAAPQYVLEPFQRDLFITTLYHFMDAARYGSLIKADGSKVDMVFGVM